MSKLTVIAAVLICTTFTLIFTSFMSGSCNEDPVDEYGAEVRILEDTCSCKIGVGHARVIDIVSDDYEYQFLINNLDFLTFYINRIKNEYSMEDMRKLVDIVEEQEMEVIVELGGVLGPGWGGLTDIDNGKKSAQVEIKNSLNWIRAGGKIDYIIFDGPIRRLLYGDISKNISDNNGVLVSGHFNTNRGPFSYEEAADEILYSMAEWREVYPEIKFILGCNFPNWGWKGQQDYHKRQADGMNWGDYWEVVKVVMNKVQSSATPFNAMIIDWPYNYAIGEKYSHTPGNDPTAIDWIARILEMEEYVKGLGLEFYLYTNTEEKESNVVYSESTLKYVDLYRQRGGAPDGWNVQSWYPVPTSFGPEYQQFSMSWLTNEVIKKLRNLDDSIPHVEPDTNSMNVLLIMTDQHTFSALGASGNEQINTPNLDRLTEDGAYFTHCIAPTPDCSPARASILTGLSTNHHGIWNNVDKDAGLPGLDKQVFPVTEELLYEQGYNTLHWGKLQVCNTNTRPKDYITEPWHSNTDFLCYENWPFEISGNRDAALAALDAEAFNRGYPDWNDWNDPEHVNRIPVIAQAMSSYVSDIGESPVPAMYTREFAFGQELMEAMDIYQDYPWMFTLSLSPPQKPWNVPDPYYGMYDPGSLLLSDNQEVAFSDALAYSASVTGGREIREKGRREFLRTYYGQITMIDDMIGEVLDRLDALGLRERTLIVFTSDHGDMAGSHTALGKELPAFFEPQVRVPLIVSFPGKIPGGTVVDELVTPMDIMPTILDYAGYAGLIPEDIDGSSLRPLIEGDTGSWRDHVIGMRDDPTEEPNTQYMIRNDRWKYWWNYSEDLVAHLYDLETDPLEKNNLAMSPDHHDMQMELHNALAGWVKQEQAPQHQLMEYMEALGNLERKSPSLRLQIQPNPASDRFTIQFTTEKQGEVSLRLFDISGRLMRSDRLEIAAPGMHEFSGSTAGLASGSYYILLEDETSIDKAKLLITDP